MPPKVMPQCPECGNKGRHKITCSRKRKSSLRGGMAGTFLERFREKIKSAPDGVLAACIHTCMEEADARRTRIEDEARERIRMLDEILPVPKRPMAASSAPAGLPTHEVPPVPGHLQCGNQCPEDSKVFCTQQRTHEGMHRNYVHKKVWQRKVA
jgi:hypothetical protein